MSRPYEGRLHATEGDGNVVILGFRPNEGGVDTVATVWGANFHEAQDTAARLVHAYRSYDQLVTALLAIVNANEPTTEGLQEMARQTLEGVGR